METSQITLSFANVSGKKIEADFDGGTTTSDGGVLLLRQAEARTWIVNRLVGAMSDRLLVLDRQAVGTPPARRSTSWVKPISTGALISILPAVEQGPGNPQLPTSCRDIAKTFSPL